MEAYGFADWEGNDRHFMGWAGTGVHFDPIIASNAAHWLASTPIRADGDARGPSRGSSPVALVNPHDVMWFPIDQPGYRERHPDEVGRIRHVLESAEWKDDDLLPVYTDPYDEVCDELPANFDDDLLDKPEAQRQWRWDQQHGLWGYIDPDDKAAWLRHLDYYVKLHQLADRNLGTVLAALEDAGAYDDTIVIFTSDHGDMCGSHGLRSKGPVRLRGDHAGAALREGAGRDHPRHRPRRRSARTSTSRRPSARSAAWTRRGRPTLQGADLSPVLADPSARVRDHVLFAHDTAQTNEINKVRYAIRGFFDGRTKYARYYGVGGGKPSTGLWGKIPGTQALRRRRRVRRPGPRVVRPRRATPTSWSTSRTTGRAGRSCARSTNGCAGTRQPRSSTSLSPSPSERELLADGHPTGAV